MTIEDLKNVYENGNKFQLATGMPHGTYHNWMRYGYIPILSQLKLEKITGGILKADLNHIPGDKK